MITWSPHNHMITWPYDHMITRSFDHTICLHDHMPMWSYDHMTTWPYDHVIARSFDSMIIWSHGHWSTWGRPWVDPGSTLGPPSQAIYNVLYFFHFSANPAIQLADTSATPPTTPLSTQVRSFIFVSLTHTRRIFILWSPILLCFLWGYKGSDTLHPVGRIKYLTRGIHTRKFDLLMVLYTVRLSMRITRR